MNASEQTYDLDEILLTTKLHPPPPGQTLVPRPQLNVALSWALTHTLTIVSAPAGYGKTTLVSSWLRELQAPAAWIALDERDNDPVRFLQYFISCLQNLFPSLPLNWLASSQTIQGAPLNTCVHLIANELARLETPFVLVLDDFHTLDAPAVPEMISVLLEHAPPPLHLVIISRTDPALPLARLRARGQLVEIRAEQLRFNTQETALFFDQVAGLRLSGRDLAALEARTEGWAAGLQLAALSMQGCADPPAFISAFTGSHFYIMDYLTEEVLKCQPEYVRSFLLQTSILTSMCAPLCEAVVFDSRLEAEAGRARPDSLEILETLERSNLFIIPLDLNRNWYRYHHLFSDVLNLRLGHQYPDQVPELHRRASHWYEQNEMIPDAIRHALLAKDMERAAQLVEAHGCSLLMSGEGFTLLKWVEAVQPAGLAHPWLAVLKAWALALAGRLDQVEPVLLAVEGPVSRLPLSPEVNIVLGSIATVRAFLATGRGDSHQAAQQALAGLAYLPEGNTFSCSMRGLATSILGDATWLTGDLNQARAAYQEAVQISQAAGISYMTLLTQTNLAGVLAEQGELHRAAQMYAEALQLGRQPGGQVLPCADRACLGLGEIVYAWNHLDEATRYIQQGLELGRRWGNLDTLAKGSVLAAWLEQARGEAEAGQSRIQAAEKLACEGRLSPRLTAWVKRAAAHWRLAQGEAGPGLQLLPQAGREGAASLGEAEYPLFARLQLAQGDFETALDISRRLDGLAAAAGKTGLRIEALILQALAWQGKNDPDQAVMVLEEALALAQPEGYARVFLDEGEPLARLLFRAKNRPAKAARLGEGYAAGLLAMLDGLAPDRAALPQHLVEPLTRRELEVLQLIEAGCSNPVIAARLFISLPTVKRHLSNIYAKLGAKSRTQAVSLGRQLGLFD